MRQSDQTLHALARTRTSGSVGTVLCLTGTLAAVVCLTGFGPTLTCLPGVFAACAGAYLKRTSIVLERCLRDSLAREDAYEHRHGVR